MTLNLLSSVQGFNALSTSERSRLRHANAVSVLASPTEGLGIDQSIGRVTQSVAAI
jgi:hypothetical protein